MKVENKPPTIKEALELYENGKHRRYNLLFSVNGGAFAIAKILNTTQSDVRVVLGGLKITHLAIGMAIFTFIMAVDIYKFGERSGLEKSSYESGEQSNSDKLPEIFGDEGKSVLISLTLLIITGWLLVGLCC